MSVFTRVKEFFHTYLKPHLNSRAAVILTTILCLLSLGYQYFRQDSAFSPTTIIGAVIVPFQQGINDIGGFLFRTEQDKISLDQAKERITALEDDNEALLREKEELQSIRIENQELRALLAMKNRLGDYTTLGAQIIGNDGTNVFERFTINRGAMDGVKLNMNIIDANGLVGFVSKVGLNYAVVTTIVEDGVSVSAMTQNSRQTCIVTGSLDLKGQNTLKLENALAVIDFSTDGKLVTSDISDRFLPGLPIGYASGMKKSSDGLTQSGSVMTAVDFTNLHQVLVIMELKEAKEDAAP
ncbi:MAG: rod shape-determining protein MreC [Lachnospiraceae bacterium]|nr:rod shape-determining protein MreC [Lachnospiraceae bacterium]